MLIAAAALAAAPRARAGVPAARRTLGLLYPNPTRSPLGDALETFSAWLKDLGWSVGAGLDLVNASAEGREERLPALAAMLVEKRVDVIWAAGPEAAVAAARATHTIPIAFYGVSFPVEQGLVESLARPGTNVTGLASTAPSLSAKGLEALREIAPYARRLARIKVETVMHSVAGDEVRVRDGSVEADAARLGFELYTRAVSAPEDLGGAFSGIARRAPQALVCDFTAMTFRERARIVAFANGHRLPSAFGTARFVEAGGLLSHGADRAWMIRHSFVFVDRILRGARPGELPVEQPGRFELWVNRSTARLLGLEIPRPVLLRADRVIE